MNNEELKKKILVIVRGAMLEADELPFIETTDNIADALIDANIFVDIDTLKDEQQSMNGILTNMSSYMNYKLHELEHRAARAERALRNCVEYYRFTHLCPIPDCECSDKCWGETCVSDIVEYLEEQAEKELAEEGK